MHSARISVHRYKAVVLAVIVSACSGTAAAESMPPAQQNMLVQKYCAVCHTDAAKNGGLSLEHFDAAQAPPTLMAMLLSKVTGGVLLKSVQEASSNASAARFLDEKMRFGAMGAAGIPIPDKATIEALIQALATESVGAMDWTIQRSKDPADSAPVLTASILREVPSPKEAGEAEVYRLIVSCKPTSQYGYVQLAWAPVPQSGALAISVDGNAAVEYRVEGSEKMGNGSGVVLHGLAALVLAETKRGASGPGWPFPAEALTISDLFPGETVTFPFASLPKDARQSLNACFPGAGSSDHLASSRR